MWPLVMYSINLNHLTRDLLRRLGLAKKARTVEVVKVCLCVNTVSLHYSNVMIIIHGIASDWNFWFLDIRISTCNLI